MGCPLFITEPRLGRLRPEESCRGRLRRETMGCPLFQGGEARAFRRAPLFTLVERLS
jgi:hypothetical protein